MTRLLPYSVAESIAIMLGEIFGRLLVRPRAYIRANLEHVLPDRVPVNRLVIKTFVNYMRCLLDFFRLGFVDRRHIVDDVAVSGFENCFSALRQKRGAVLITFHLGNWDYAGSYLAARGIPMSALVEELEPAMLRLYTRHRERTGMHTYPVTKSAYAFLDCIRKNRILAVLADRDIAGGGRPLKVFSGRRRFPSNLGSIIARRRLPVLFAYLVLNPAHGGRRYVGHVNPPVSFASESDFHLQLISKLEEFVGAYPDQWFVFQPEWLA